MVPSYLGDIAAVRRLLMWNKMYGDNIELFKLQFNNSIILSSKHGYLFMCRNKCFLWKSYTLIIVSEGFAIL